MLELDRLRRAYHHAREALLAERVPEGHWVGELSSSPLSTATACSALAIAARHAPPDVRARYQSLIDAGLRWILDRQNRDGGWGDTDLSLSNISTTMLVRAAVHLAGAAERHAVALQRAETYITALGGIAGLRKRYGKDKTFAVPILTNCALAGLVPWSEVSPLPFELACLPQSWYRFARLPVVSYAIPALVAIGQARYFHQKPWNPVARVVRAASVERSLTVLQKMQPASGGYLEATPLTSFVVMSLASIGRHDHAVTQLGLKFLVESVRPDGSWPIDTNLATWVTTLAINALSRETASDPRYLTPELLAWILKCQHTERHPFTGADPGGWGWSDLSGAVPDADDTPGALLALMNFLGANDDQDEDASGMTFAAVRTTTNQAVRWLEGLQNTDGGWPTFCRGWGALPFDRSGTDLTAHVVRALHRWFYDPILDYSCDEAIRGAQYLANTQRRDGSWLPLWFGNQWGDDDENPLYGTARVLLAYRDLGRMQDEPARRGIDYLLTKQNPDGGWGGIGMGSGESGMGNVQTNPSVSSPQSPASVSSVEETAVVVEALFAAFQRSDVQSAARRGLMWLVEAVETGRFRQPSPIGFYFAKLWYYEKLYPMIFTVGALRTAVETLDETEPRA